MLECEFPKYHLLLSLKFKSLIIKCNSLSVSAYSCGRAAFCECTLYEYGAFTAMTVHTVFLEPMQVYLQLWFLQCVWKVDRSSSQLACSQPVLFQPVSTPGSPWSSVGDSGMGQTPLASSSFATAVTYSKPDAAVLSVSAGSALEVSSSLLVS